MGEKTGRYRTSHSAWSGGRGSLSVAHGFLTRQHRNNIGKKTAEQQKERRCQILGRSNYLTNVMNKQKKERKATKTKNHLVSASREQPCRKGKNEKPGESKRKNPLVGKTVQSTIKSTSAAQGV